MTDKLTTAQKAEAYVSGYRHSRLTVAKEAIEIITAMLTERQAFISLLKDMVESDSLMGRITDEQVKKAIAMCEETK